MISQPRYLPFLGYLQRIQRADLFIVLDNVHRANRQWENRNKVLDQNHNQQWLTIPVKSSSRSIICDTEIAEGFDFKEHYELLKRYYPFVLGGLLPKHRLISKLSIQSYLNICNEGKGNYAKSLIEGLKEICDLFEITTPIILASDIVADNADRLVDFDSLLAKEKIEYLLRCVGGTEYITGPSCLDYGLTQEYLGQQVKLNIHDWSKENAFTFLEGPHLAFVHYLMRYGYDAVYEIIHRK